MADVRLAGMRRASHGAEDVRMGPLALFTLMAVLCLAVLAVLAVSTADATLTLSQRRAEATTQLYLDEAAAQTFVAALDGELAQGHGGQAALDAAAEAAADSVPADSPYQLSITTTLSRTGSYEASFDCGNGRQLEIALHEKADGSLGISTWRMTTVTNDEPTIGGLWGGL